MDISIDKPAWETANACGTNVRSTRPTTTAQNSLSTAPAPLDRSKRHELTTCIGHILGVTSISDADEVIGALETALKDVSLPLALVRHPVVAPEKIVIKSRVVRDSKSNL